MRGHDRSCECELCLAALCGSDVPLILTFPAPYKTVDWQGKRHYHGRGFYKLALANLELGGSPSPGNREAILHGYCCEDAMLTDWHGREKTIRE